VALSRAVRYTPRHAMLDAPGGARPMKPGEAPRVGSAFDRVAHAYEELWDTDFRWLQDDLNAMLDLRPGQRLVDLACGPGANLIAMAHRAERPRLALGVDLSLSMLKKGREKVAQNGHLPIEFVHADMEAFCRWARPGQFDVVTVRFALAYLPAAYGVAGPAQLVAPGGQIGFCTSTHSSIWQVMTVLLEMCKDFGYDLPPLNSQVPRDAAEMESRLDAAGLKIVEMRNIRAPLARPRGADLLQYLRDTGYVFHPFVEQIVPEAQDVIQEEMGRRMDEKYRRPDGLVSMDFDFLLVTARKK
jgi:SAM-dependent methyltransferase